MTELESKLDWYVDRLKDLYLREHTDDIFSASSRIGVPSCTLVGDNITDTIVSLCSVRATKESDIITQEAEEFRSGDKYWGIVTLEVVEGALSIEDVWFRSGLEVENRRASIDYRVIELLNVG
ncbi:hypothetical protein [Halovenus salina]|uniref:Uncharacterized protein n=1 Tax=Halovenus salina TaxID=1510225 RepID=A0ABD5W237_9EURY|nr:hypothetical protein [Halovenus salina]